MRGGKERDRAGVRPIPTDAFDNFDRGVADELVSITDASQPLGALSDIELASGAQENCHLVEKQQTTNCSNDTKERP